MNVILLSGGSGKRLWPLSNNARSKQFLKLFTNANGEKESMVQRVYRQLRQLGPDVHVTIATSVTQVDSIRSQLGAEVDLVTEPERRDTYPAILLAASYLYDQKKCGVDEPVIVMPVDPYTVQAYFETIRKMEQAVREDAADIVLMGMRPTYPSEKYGYILPNANRAGECYSVERFAEKPKSAEAERLIARGALWNGGVFAFRLKYLLDRIWTLYGEISYSALRDRYCELKKISFDYEVVEKSDSVAVIPFDGPWKDLGTWNTLSEEIDASIGFAVSGEGTKNTQIINELDIPLVALGAEDMVIVASSDGILVAGKDASSYMKPYVDALEQRPMFEERRWGSYKVIDFITYQDGRKSLTKHLTVKAEKRLSYQSHEKRDEIWTIVDGEGVLLLDGHTRNVSRGDVVYITAGKKHALAAVTDLHMIEVQIGAELNEEDIIRYSMEW